MAGSSWRRSTACCGGLEVALDDGQLLGDAGEPPDGVGGMGGTARSGRSSSYIVLSSRVRALSAVSNAAQAVRSSLAVGVGVGMGLGHLAGDVGVDAGPRSGCPCSHLTCRARSDRVGRQVGVDRTPPLRECRQLVGGGVDLAAALAEPARPLVDDTGCLLGVRRSLSPGVPDPSSADRPSPTPSWCRGRSTRLRASSQLVLGGGLFGVAAAAGPGRTWPGSRPPAAERPARRSDAGCCSVRSACWVHAARSSASTSSSPRTGICVPYRSTSSTARWAATAGPRSARSRPNTSSHCRRASSMSSATRWTTLSIAAAGHRRHRPRRPLVCSPRTRWPVPVVSPWAP